MAAKFVPKLMHSKITKSFATELLLRQHTRSVYGSQIIPMEAAWTVKSEKARIIGDFLPESRKVFR